MEELAAWLNSPHKASSAAALSPGAAKGVLEGFDGDDGEGPRDNRVRRSGPCSRSGGNVLTPVKEEEEQVGAAMLTGLPRWAYGCAIVQDTQSAKPLLCGRVRVRGYVYH
jgi:hypothetical protein